MVLNQCSFQDSFSDVMEECVLYHDLVLVVVGCLSILISVMLYKIMFSWDISLFMMENKVLEFVWTMSPLLVLLVMAIPSMKLLYVMDNMNIDSSGEYYKVVGNQWYWSYNYDFLNNSLDYDSYMLNDDALSVGDFRLLEVDNPLICKVNSLSNFLITASDVIHSFAVPCLHLKIDAIPGRLNQQSVVIDSLGSFYGQCSELCGVNHSFMPINIEVVV